MENDKNNNDITKNITIINTNKRTTNSNKKRVYDPSDKTQSWNRSVKESPRKEYNPDKNKNYKETKRDIYRTHYDKSDYAGTNYNSTSYGNFYMMTSASTQHLNSDNAYNSRKEKETSIYDTIKLLKNTHTVILNPFCRTPGTRYTFIPGFYTPVSLIYIDYFNNTPLNQALEPKEILDKLCQFYTEYTKKENIVLKENFKPLWQEFYEYNLKNSGKQELIIPKITVGEASIDKEEYKEAIKKGERIILSIDDKGNFVACMFIVIDQKVYFQKETYIYKNIK